MIIFRYPEAYDEDHAVQTNQLVHYSSFTPEVLRGMWPLKRFEIAHMTPRVASEHVTVSMLRALATHNATHNATLRRLSIHSDGAVSEEFLEELLRFVEASNLTSLSIRLIVPKRCGDLVKGIVFPVSLKMTKVKVSSTPRSPARREPGGDRGQSNEWAQILVEGS
jgi:hypothetical protein